MPRLIKDYLKSFIKNSKKAKNALAFHIRIYTSAFWAKKSQKTSKQRRIQAETNSLESCYLPRVLRGAHCTALRAVQATLRTLLASRRIRREDAFHALSQSGTAPEFIHDDGRFNVHYRSFLPTSLLSQSDTERTHKQSGDDGNGFSLFHLICLMYRMNLVAYWLSIKRFYYPT